jgi:hypothetical protein
VPEEHEELISQATNVRGLKGPRLFLPGKTIINPTTEKVADEATATAAQDEGKKPVRQSVTP